MQKKYLTSDVARALECSASLVHKLAANGTLPAAERTVSGVRLFNHSDVQRLARERAARRASKAAQEG